MIPIQKGDKSWISIIIDIKRCRFLIVDSQPTTLVDINDLRELLCVISSMLFKHYALSFKQGLDGFHEWPMVTASNVYEKFLKPEYIHDSGVFMLK